MRTVFKCFIAFYMLGVCLPSFGLLLLKPENFTPYGLGIEQKVIIIVFMAISTFIGVMAIQGMRKKFKNT